MKDWKKRFRDLFIYKGHGIWHRKVDGYEDENDTFVERPHEAYAVPVFFEGFIQEERRKAKEEGIDQSIARVSVEVMDIALFKKKDEFDQGHEHGLRRAVYVLNELKQSLAEEKI